MSSEFFAMARYQMALPGTPQGIDGGLIPASALTNHTLVRRKLAKYPYLQRHLFDPQVYLVGLQPALARKACANLSSYGWFPINSRLDFSSSELKPSDWSLKARADIHHEWVGEVQREPSEIENAILACLDTQTRIDCEALILPSPLTIDQGDDYSLELSWLDQGLELSARQYPRAKRFATIAISDSALRSQDPWKNSLLDLVLDQVCARRPEGAYIVLESASESGYYINHPNTVGALLRLVAGLKDGGIQTIIVAFCGTAGLLAVAAGADIWSAGWYRGERKLRLTDFEDNEGRAVPTYYSTPLAGEFHLEKDLDLVNDLGLLERFSDETSASLGLVRALKQGLPVSSVLEWQYRFTNVAAAREHFLRVAVRETGKLRNLSRQQRVDYTLRWLAVADSEASRLMALGSFNPRTALNHQATWRQAFERFVQETAGS